jgi:hypothetical protein
MENGPIIKPMMQNHEPTEFHIALAPYPSTTKNDREFITIP